MCGQTIGGADFIAVENTQSDIGIADVNSQ
jgi:hypothetical protein